MSNNDIRKYMLKSTSWKNGMLPLTTFGKNKTKEVTLLKT